MSLASIGSESVLDGCQLMRHLQMTRVILFPSSAIWGETKLNVVLSDMLPIMNSFEGIRTSWKLVPEASRSPYNEVFVLTASSTV